MNSKRSLVETTALAFGMALMMAGEALSLPGATPVVQAGTEANLNASAQAASAGLAAPASTYQVTNNNASGAGSLYLAILGANEDSTPATITFAPNVSGTIVLTGSLPAIANTLTIAGPGANVLAVSGANAYRVFLINPGVAVNISGLTIRDGNGGGSGGGISSAGTLVLSHVNVVSNTANYGGGVYQGGTGRVDVSSSLIALNHSGNQGGGLYINGDVALTDTLVLTNTAGADGGGLTDWAGRTDLTGGTFTANRAGGNGGGINVNNSLSISGTQFISNTAANGGGLLQWNAGYTVAVTNARFERNQASNNGGGLYVAGSAALTNTQILSNTTGNNGFGGGMYVNTTSATVSGGQIFSNTARLGGGVYIDTGRAATLSGVQIFHNLARGGGGVYVWDGGTAIVSGGQIFSNTATHGDGGGIFVYYGGIATVSATSILSNSAVGVGGISNEGALTVTNSTVSGNTGAFGGIENLGTLTLINSTLSGNQATGGPAAGGGAIYQLVIYNPIVNSTLVNSTLVSNTSATASRSGIWIISGTLSLQNSIVAYNSGANNVQVDGGTFTSQGYNLTNSGAGTPFTATGDLTNASPLLGPLQDNGGSTWTHALLTGSPAIDRIPFGANGCGTSVTTDQRGWPRPFPPGGKCDIGAFEFSVLHLYLPGVMRSP